MSKTFEEMNKAELQEVAELYKLTDAVKEEAEKQGKNVSKIPNNIYVDILNAFKESKADTDGETKKATEQVGNGTSSAGEPIEVVKRRYARSKGMYIVTDHDNTSSTEEELEGMVVPIRWGNKQGKVVTSIALHGRPQYVPQGAIDAMAHIKIPTNTKNKSTRTKQRFQVVEVDGWTQEQIDTKIEEQRLKREV